MRCFCGSADGMKSSLLTHDLQNKHSGFKDKNLSLFKCLLENKSKRNVQLRTFFLVVLMKMLLKHPIASITISSKMVKVIRLLKI